MVTFTINISQMLAYIPYMDHFSYWHLTPNQLIWGQIPWIWRSPTACVHHSLDNMCSLFNVFCYACILVVFLGFVTVIVVLPSCGLNTVSKLMWLAFFLRLIQTIQISGGLLWYSRHTKSCNCHLSSEVVFFSTYLCSACSWNQS